MEEGVYWDKYASETNEDGEPIKCRCGALVNKIEDVSGVGFSYEWKQDAWKELDANYYGSISVTFECSACGIELDHCNCDDDATKENQLMKDEQ